MNMKLLAVVIPPYIYNNDCIKVSIGGKYEAQAVKKCLMQVSLRELHNSMIFLT